MPSARAPLPFTACLSLPPGGPFPPCRPGVPWAHPSPPWPGLGGGGWNRQHLPGCLGPELAGDSGIQGCPSHGRKAQWGHGRSQHGS